MARVEVGIDEAFFGFKAHDTHAGPSTTVAAKTLGDLGMNLGAISVGKSVDIIAVKTDPTVNLKTMEAVSFVMKSGTVF